MTDARAILLDTDVYSLLYMTPRDSVAKNRHPVEAWEGALEGNRPVISFQTRAEILSGAYLAGWGQKRVAVVTERLVSTPTIVVDDDVVEAYSRLVAAARKEGHALGVPKQHVGDRWIAACAIAKGLPLLTGNRRHFEGAPGLTLIELAG